MKRMKKLFALLLAVVMVMGLGLTVSAEQGINEDNGTITIEDAVPGETYSIYQILVLESYNTVTDAYSYKAADGWTEFLQSKTNLIDINDNGYVTWIGANEDSVVAGFAKDALAYAEEHQIQATKAMKAPAAAEGEDYSTVVFENLSLGWYLADTSLGALCSLQTTDPDVTIEEKNEVPSIKKEIVENEGNKPSVGDAVTFKITVTAQKGAQDYIVHDTMTDGLTFNNDVVIKSGGTTLQKDKDYTVKTEGLEDSCTFEIRFDVNYLNTITAPTELEIIYTAIINANAVVGEDKETNTAILDYGDDSSTEPSTTPGFTVYSFDLVKTDNKSKVLDGAQFELYDAAKAGSKINLVAVTPGQKGAYRVATAEERMVSGFESAVIETVDGKATIDGLGSGTYYLEETKAPDGYNKLAERMSITIGTVDNSATVQEGIYINGGLQVINETGSLLPSTGGMGTTLIYIAGAVLVIGAGVLLVVRRRMNAEQ